MKVATDMVTKEESRTRRVSRKIDYDSNFSPYPFLKYSSILER